MNILQKFLLLIMKIKECFSFVKKHAFCKGALELN